MGRFQKIPPAEPVPFRATWTWNPWWPVNLWHLSKWSGNANNAANPCKKYTLWKLDKSALPCAFMLATAGIRKSSMEINDLQLEEAVANARKDE